MFLRKCPASDSYFETINGEDRFVLSAVQQKQTNVCSDCIGIEMNVLIGNQVKTAGIDFT